jgi:beta-mannosidase
MNEEQALDLTLLAPLAADARELDGEWRVAFPPAQPPAGDRAYAAPDFDDSGWEKVRLPHLRYSTAERDTLWYRHHFKLESLPRSARTLLRFGGAFYETRVWLNGVELGAHQGYFQPFGFDVGDSLRVGENVMAVRCRFPVEAGAFKRKTAVAGIFTDWDCKPYPSTYYPNLPAPHEWTVPLGLWQPVHLQASGAVLVESFTVFPEVINPRWTEGADSAVVRVVLQLRPDRPVVSRIGLDIAPHNFAGGPAAHGEREIELAGETSRRLELLLTVPQPRLWFPWTHGAPHLYRARLSLQGEDGTPRELDRVFGIRAIQAVTDEQHWEWQLNGRRIFPKGSNYISDFYLDRVSVEGLSRDLALARQANLDLLRVHAHIGSPDFYRLCDEQGMMVLCDFPLIWTYAFNLPREEQEAFQASVQRQVGDMVGLLGSHPSIILWSIHNEPPWTPKGSFLGEDVHASGTNRLIDEAAAERVRALDATRPTIAAAGQYDQHLYHGWYTGSWRDNRDLRPTFPTEFGVQALPNLGSPFWGTVSTNWPVDGDDPTWAHAGYQSVFWVSPGVGAPSQYASLAEYVKESQAYQAFYARYTIDQWRRRKFQPVGGYAHYLFTDGWPAITWAVLDYYRLPKAAYRALAQASSPAHVCIDLEDGYTVEGGFHLVYADGGRFKAGLYLANDDYRLNGRAQLRWWLEPRQGSRLRRWLRRWLAPRMAVELPRADEGARLTRSVDMPLAQPGEYTFHTRLTQGSRVLDENRYDLRVGAPAARRHTPRRVPGFLVHRLVEPGNLRHTADGFTFRLRNPAMPMVVQRLVELRADGELIDLAQVDAIRGVQSRRASTITPEAPLAVSSGEHLTVVVREHPLLPGAHELEATAQLLGFGEITARWRDRLV